MFSKVTASKRKPPVPSSGANTDRADTNGRREKAEREEVTGRHKNDSQKPHKGAP